MLTFLDLALLFLASRLTLILSDQDPQALDALYN